MKITSISYKKIFPIAQYVNETIGVEMQVDEGDDVDESFEMARKQVNSWHKTDTERYGPIAEPVHLEVKQPKEFVKWDHTPPTIDPPHVDDVYLDEIIFAKSIEELGDIKKKGVKSEYMPYYMKRMKELTPKTI